MADVARRSPYVWVSWLTGLLSGEKQCRYAVWYKANYKYDKLDSNFDAVRWRGEHAALVRRRTDLLRTDGWTVAVENENAFQVRGRTATLAGCPDIVAVRAREPSTDRRAISLAGTPATAGEVRIDDCKTGKRRDSDWWQVSTYLCFLRDVRPDLTGHAVSGMVAYTDGSLQAVPAPDRTVLETIAAVVREAASETVQAATPSQQECSMCDIASCPYRVAVPTVREAVTGEF